MQSLNTITGDVTTSRDKIVNSDVTMTHVCGLIEMVTTESAPDQSTPEIKIHANPTTKIATTEALVIMIETTDTKDSSLMTDTEMIPVTKTSTTVINDTDMIAPVNTLVASMI